MICIKRILSSGCLTTTCTWWTTPILQYTISIWATTWTWLKTTTSSETWWISVASTRPISLPKWVKWAVCRVATTWLSRCFLWTHHLWIQPLKWATTKTFKALMTTISWTNSSIECSISKEATILTPQMACQTTTICTRATTRCTLDNLTTSLASRNSNFTSS